MNDIKTGRLIEMRENAPLSMEHIQTVMSVMGNIQNTISSVLIVLRNFIIQKDKCANKT
jgi:hypothetical protein